MSRNYNLNLWNDVLFNCNSHGILITDSNGKIKSINKKFTKITNYSKSFFGDNYNIKNIFGEEVNNVFPLNNKTKPFCKEIKNVSLVSKDGTKKIINLEIVFVPSSEEVIFLVYDITKRNEFEEKLKKQNQLLKLRYEISNALQATDDLNEIFNLSIKAFKENGYDRVRIYLFDKNKKALIGKRSSGEEDAIMGNVILEIDESYKKVHHCFTKKKPIVLSTKHKTQYHKHLKKEGVEETASIPLLSGEKVVGMISIDNKHSKKQIKKEDLINIVPLANHIAVAIENALLHLENRKKLRKLTALYDISTSLSTSVDLDKILNLIIIKIVKLVKCDICSVTLLDKSKEFLIPKSTYASPKEYFKCGPVPYDNSVSGLALKTNQPVYIADVLGEPLYCYKRFAKESKLKSLLSVPLVLKNEALGVINLYTKKEKKYSKNEVDLLKSLASQIALSIKNYDYFERINNEKESFSHLLKLSQVINSQLKIENLLKIILEKTLEYTGADAGYLLLIKEDALELKHMRGYSNTDVGRISIKIGEGITGLVAQQGKPIVVSDVRSDPKYIALNKETMSEAAIPLIKAGKVIGVLNLESRKYGAFKRFQKPLEILTNQIAVAIENSRLYHEISLFNETLKNEVYMATKELVEKNKELERMDKLKSDFVSNVSHELRTPLTSIKGYAKLLADGRLGELPEKHLQCMNIVLEETDRLTRLINDVLDLAKLERGKIRYKKEKVNLVTVGDNVINTLATLADDKDIKIHFNVSDDLPLVNASQDLIKQVFFNLIGNAIKFTPQKGNIYVDIVEESRQTNPNNQINQGNQILQSDQAYLKVTVRDTGIGIPKEIIPKLFDKFYQVDSSMTREHGGTGLGLPISKHIIEIHKGEIYVESKVGKGSSFIFALPLRKE
ncbi:GAF domain-containing protein [Candidatus Woesearchaeota archaeon]|jgi:PAS domain S-box-containing protein|nr:GAF domain-containing protein [Candidatus Woesearchaeota archaeon]MBT5273117.1 GAF domain-containing protein [Candidatus Woesearchaeota archaeon]MBT6040781.1 GAF domain-containing protein [Candidatus Woesearchaeota archaeon]MBT6337568.1 GAF domain-containing protein [Candidatus Woesearchaeota archaeon]MBT7927031.1 GAF domain-containing protein [Candidatus Woesearchaeota archaeon]